MIYKVPETAMAEVRMLVSAAVAAQDRASSAGRAIMHMLGVNPDDPAVKFDAAKGTIEVPDLQAAPLPSDNGAAVPATNPERPAPSAG